MSWAWILPCVALLVGCGDDDGTSTPRDAGGGDSGPDGATGDDTGTADASATDAGPPVCAPSDTPGCQETCQFFYDCVVQSSIAEMIQRIFPGVGFSGPGFMDCSGCIAQCEAGSGNEAALACFQDRAATTFCAPGAADPTVAANAVNDCCDGQLGSTFCVDVCEATATLSDFFPMCRPYLRLPQPSSCAGGCPDVTAAAALSVDATGDFAVNSAAFSPAGDLAVTGYYDGTIDFGAGPLAAADEGAVQFVAVFAPDGAPRWSARLGDGTGVPETNARSYFDAVAFDGDGNVVVLTETTGSLDLGAGPLPSLGGADLVLASWTADGSLRWSRRFGGPSDESQGELTVDGTGVLVAAQFADTASFGGGPLTSVGDLDMVVARYDGEGNHLWSRAVGGPEADIVYAVAAHPGGDYTLAGGIGAGGDLGAGPIAVEGPLDVFVARYGDDGTVRWIETHGGPEVDYAYQITIDGEAAVLGEYVGSVEARVDYGPAIVSGVSTVVARYDADGGVSWVVSQPFDGTRAFIIGDLAVGGSRQVLMGAALSGTIDFGCGPLTSVGGLDVSLAAFDAGGGCSWAMRMGTLGDEDRPFVSRLATGEIAAVGYFHSNLDYGAGVLTRPGPDIFLLRLAAD